MKSSIILLIVGLIIIILIAIFIFYIKSCRTKQAKKINKHKEQSQMENYDPTAASKIKKHMAKAQKRMQQRTATSTTRFRMTPQQMKEYIQTIEQHDKAEQEEQATQDLG